MTAPPRDTTELKTAASKTSAFDAAVSEADYEYGHRGYTGQINVNGSYQLFDFPGSKLNDVIEACLDYSVDTVMTLLDWDERRATRLVETYNDKWGPACAVEVEPGTFKFFGMASC